MGSRRTAESSLVAAKLQTDDFIWAHRHSNGCDLLRGRTFSSSTVCARLSFGSDDAIVGSIPQRMGIPHGSDPTGRWNRPGPEQTTSGSCNLVWRINDRPHAISISAYVDP